ncbi:alpha/beta hydrolase [Naumannella halotolerans]|uniref:alpha/beta hydrolase n=1 Tax=Naumannella halotolerans TaxID=993414 RepID=UPI00370D9B7A
MKKALLLAASVVATSALIAPLSLTGAVAAPSEKTSSYIPPAIEWGECDSARLVNAGAECGMLEVPLDYDRPNARKIKIAVSRKLHTDDDYRGMIAVNPGGPGGSGLIYSVLGGSIPDGVGAKYDWYGFDPRGVGSSEPALSCDPDYAGAGYDRPNYVPEKAKDMKWWRQTTKQYAKDCKSADARALLPYLRTTDVAKDLDSLRKAEEQEKLNYYGFSYGTYLGQVYATLFPEQVGRFVWDGVLNADNAFYEANLDQERQFDENLDYYFQWLADYDDVYGLGSDWRKIKRGYYQQLDKLDKRPAADGKLGPDELNDVMLSAGYYVYGWTDIAEAYAALVHDGDGSLLLDQYGGPGDDNSFAVYNAVQCTDAPWPNWNTTKADAWAMHDEHPFMAWNNTWYNAPCLNWPAAANKQPFKVSGAKVDSPILMVAETYDAATVFSGALATRKKFPNSVLIEGVGGTTHSGSLSGIACTDDTIAAYLDTGELPDRKSGNRSDKQCDPVPAPVPATADAEVTAKAVAQRTGPAVEAEDAMPADLREGLRQAQANR